MLLYLHKGKSIGQRTIFRNIRSIIILLVIISSYWLINRNLRLVYYIQTVLGITLLLVDYHRPKTVLADIRIKLPDYAIMVIMNLFLAGTILISGASHSPLLGIILIPVILFGAEFGTIIGIWNYLITALFVIFTLVFSATPLTFYIIARNITLIVCSGACLTIIRTFHHSYNHYNRKIERLLTHDELTGLYNRRFLKSAVLKEIKSNKNFGLVLIDINYFKYYNDYWGHSAGDNLLINIGKVINKSIRPQDIAVRHSGDEFIVLVPESNQTIVESTINKINLSIESNLFPGEECFPENKLSISYGFSLFPNDARNYQALFTTADQSLYKYKREHFH